MIQCACCGTLVPEYGWALCDICNDLTFQVSANAYQNNMSIKDTINSIDLTDHQKEFLIDWFIPFKETIKYSTSPHAYYNRNVEHFTQEGHTQATRSLLNDLNAFKLLVQKYNKQVGDIDAK